MPNICSSLNKNLSFSGSIGAALALYLIMYSVLLAKVSLKNEHKFYH